MLFFRPPLNTLKDPDVKIDAHDPLIPDQDFVVQEDQEESQTNGISFKSIENDSVLFFDKETDATTVKNPKEKNKIRKGDSC